MICHLHLVKALGKYLTLLACGFEALGLDMLHGLIQHWSKGVHVYMRALIDPEWRGIKITWQRERFIWMLQKPGHLYMSSTTELHRACILVSGKPNAQAIMLSNINIQSLSNMQVI